MDKGLAVDLAVRKQLRRADRLRVSKDFRRIQRSGSRIATHHFIVLTASRWVKKGACEETSPRLGLTVSRRVGHAVTRNRVKRRIREWFRQHRDLLGMQGDIVVIARQGAGDLSLEQLTCQLDGAVEALQRAGGPQ